MVNYGSGNLGEETISTNDSKSNPILEYRNLTVEAGNTLTLPSRCRLLVSDTLTVDGEIVVQYDIAGSSSGGPKGGDSGGNLELMAKTITGTGTIRVDGEDGADGNNFGNRNNGGAGVGYSIPSTGATGSGASTPEVGSNADDDYENGWNGNTSGGSAGTPHSSIYDDSALKAYIEDYLISGAYITQSPIDTMLPGSGSSGAGGGSEGLDDPDRTNNYRTYRVDVGGGGGGAGGSFISQGGAGGNGDDNTTYSNSVLSNNSANNNNSANASVRGGEGGGGGGAGGFILLVSENVGTGVTFSVRGGNGGDGYWSEVNGQNVDSNDATVSFNYQASSRDGGGGGGGSGGLIIGFCDKTPTVDLSGGSGGIPGGQRRDGSNFNSNAGSTGQDGATFIYDVTELV